MSKEGKRYTYTVVDAITNEVIHKSKTKAEIRELIGLNNPIMYASEERVYKKKYRIIQDNTANREMTYRPDQKLIDSVNDVLEAARLIREGKARRKSVKINGKWVKRTVPYGL